MDVYKDFIQRLRKNELEEAYILLSGDNTEKIKKYILMLGDVKFEDGSYHTYYGDLKRILCSFLQYYSHTIDEVIKTADKYTNTACKDDLLTLITKTIDIYKASQVSFDNDFLPVNNAVEKHIYEEIDSDFKEFMNKLYTLKDTVERFDRKDTVDEFVKNNLGRAVVKTSEIFNFTYEFIGMMLADSLHRIRTSLIEIHLRMSNNLIKMQRDYEENINSLLHQLYDKNKESLSVYRSVRRCSVDIAEVNRSIDKIKSKIASFETEVPIVRLQEEVAYWKKRLEDFNEVADNLNKLKTEEDSVIQEEIIYNSFSCHELPGEKLKCWTEVGANFAKRKEYFKNAITKEAKSLLTFFVIKGTDRIIYTNEVGPQYIDEYNHQVYVFDYGLAVYHVNCEGGHKNNLLEQPYFFDKNGRYINLEGEKIYQAEQCTSQYKLGDGDLLNKITEDCGHSYRNNTQCRMQVNDPTIREMLPDFKPINIKGTLDHDTVKYLWDSFGGLLPEALFDVGMARPRNSIHYLAHKLIYHKYRRTKSELQDKAKEADLYRENIFKQRKERAKASSAAWRSKQVKRRKPEESDDAQERVVYDAHVAQQMFIHALNFMD